MHRTQNKVWEVFALKKMFVDLLMRVICQNFQTNNKNKMLFEAEVTYFHSCNKD